MLAQMGWADNRSVQMPDLRPVSEKMKSSLLPGKKVEIPPVKKSNTPSLFIKLSSINREMQNLVVAFVSGQICAELFLPCAVSILKSPSQRITLQIGA